jgi:hypothetical protein
VILLLGFLVMLPFVALRDVMRSLASWRAVPLLEKSHTRSGAASFALVALAIYTVKRGGFSSMVDVELYIVAGVAAFATLWLVVGIAGSRGSLRYDPMRIFWLGVLGLGALALLSIERWRLPRTWQFWLVRDSINRVRDGGVGCGVRLDFSTLRSA